MWLPCDVLASRWEDWPAIAAESRADMVAVVASAVAAIGGRDAPTMTAPAPAPRARWWSRPIHELLRPPAVIRSGD